MANMAVCCLKAVAVIAVSGPAWSETIVTKAIHEAFAGISVNEEPSEYVSTGGLEGTATRAFGVLLSKGAVAAIGIGEHPLMTPFSAYRFEGQSVANISDDEPSGNASAGTRFSIKFNVKSGEQTVFISALFNRSSPSDSGVYFAGLNDEILFFLSDSSSTSTHLFVTNLSVGVGSHEIWGQQQVLDSTPGDHFISCVVTVALNGATEIAGVSEHNPVLPNLQNTRIELRQGIPTAVYYVVLPPETEGIGWIDPPVADGFSYESQGGAFTDIAGFPSILTRPVSVSVDDVELGQFQPGDTLKFENYVSERVTNFSVRGIFPHVDLTNSAAFPLQIIVETSVTNIVMTSLIAPAEIHSAVRTNNQLSMMVYNVAPFSTNYLEWTSSLNENDWTPAKVLTNGNALADWSVGVTTALDAAVFRVRTR
jgi:hypothetical protein